MGSVEHSGYAGTFSTCEGGEEANPLERSGTKLERGTEPRRSSVGRGVGPWHAIVQEDLLSRCVRRLGWEAWLGRQVFRRNAVVT